MVLAIIAGGIVLAETPDEWDVSGPPLSLPSSITKSTTLELDGNAEDSTARDVGWMYLTGSTMNPYEYYTATPMDIDPGFFTTDWEWDGITFDPAVDSSGTWTVSPPGSPPYFANHYARIMNYNYTGPNDFHQDSPHAVTVTQ